MKSILFFQPSRCSAWRSLISGVQSAAVKDGWIVHTLARPENDEDYAAVFRVWNPSGCIVDCSAGERPPGDDVFAERTVVFINRPPDVGRIRHQTFTHDSVAVAKMAAEELLNTGFENYAYVPSEHPLSWSNIRGDVFKKEIAAAGKRFRKFRKGNLSEWLKSLPKPCGVFAVNDPVAQQIIAIAQQSGILVPDELAVVGVDNDEIFCEGIIPGITSIETDLESAGRQLGELLIERIAHPSHRPKIVYYAPSRIVRRGSTRLLNTRDARVTEAVDFIRRHACTLRISIDDIAEIMKCSRCEATSRFRKATGRSILEEIHEVRFQRMCELLKSSSMKISAIINFCGYKSETFPKRFFLRRTGMTMKQYRSGKHWNQRMNTVKPGGGSGVR